jgi:hypothetical protein
MVVHARTNDIADLQPLMVRVLESIGRAKRGAVINIQ